MAIGILMFYGSMRVVCLSNIKLRTKQINEKLLDVDGNMT